LAGVREDDLGRDVWTELVDALIDARTDPATTRFDAELASAVTAGALPEETATRLRFWQRASVRAVGDHARTVLPVALGALDASRREAEADAEVAAATLEAARAARFADDDQGAETDVPAQVEEIDLLRRASTPEPDRPSTLEGDRPRLLIAGLMTVLEHQTRTT
jgi:hypothetical protein